MLRSQCKLNNKHILPSSKEIPLWISHNKSLEWWLNYDRRCFRRLSAWQTFNAIAFISYSQQLVKDGLRFHFTGQLVISTDTHLSLSLSLSLSFSNCRSHRIRSDTVVALWTVLTADFVRFYQETPRVIPIFPSPATLNPLGKFILDTRCEDT